MSRTYPKKPGEPSEADEEFTELVDAVFHRVDLVGKAANGVGRFLIAKSAAGSGLLAPGTVRDLIDSADALGGPVPKSISKASGDLDAGTVLATASGDGNPDEPGSPAWEAVDAATAMKWAGILARAKHALGVLAEREEMEAFSDAGDGFEAWDLEDAACAIDAAIGLLAPYALGELAESEAPGEELVGIGKAAHGLGEGDALAALVTLEGLVPVAKAGRVLSGANENLIRSACASLQTVLATLPEPTVPEPVAKEAPVSTPKPAAEPTASETPAPVVKGAGAEVPPAPAAAAAAEPVPESTELAPLVAKAKASEMMPVYDENGKAIGVCDPTDFVPFSGAAPAGDAAAAPEDAAAPATAADLTPAPSGTVGTPADQIVKSIAVIMEEQVRAALDAKDAESASVVKALEDRLARLEAPAPSRVLSNGALPPKHMLRGMDEGAVTLDIEKAAELRKLLDGTVDVTKREAIEGQMNEQAIAALAAIRANPVRR